MHLITVNISDFYWILMITLKIRSKSLFQGNFIICLYNSIAKQNIYSGGQKMSGNPF